MASSFPKVDAGRLASYEAAVQQDPDVQAAIRAKNNHDMTAQAQLRAKYGVDEPTQIAIQKGLTPPGGGYRINQHGKLDFFQSEAWYADPRFWGPVAVGVSGGIGAAAGSGGSGGAAGGAGAASGGSGAGGGVLASSQIGTGYIPGIAGGAGLGSAAGGAAASGGVLAASQIGNGYIPAVTGGSGLGATAAGAAANAAGGVPWGDVVQRLAAAGIPIAGALVGHHLSGAGGSDASSEIPDELKQMLAMSMKRMADQQPLADAINRQALGGLPTYAKGGG